MIDTNMKTHTDIKKLIWVEKYLPQKLHPYAYLLRIDRPIGIWLLFLPGLWGLTLASPEKAPLFECTLFLIGSILMRGAGCIINDIWDRDLDKQVERTRNRPLARGDISVKNALLLLTTLLLIAFIILLQFNWITITLGCLTLPLIVLYPLMKRVTYWPQIVLGLTFNFSALMGYSAMTGTITLESMLLYIGAIFWTIGYDTIYAHQDKEDDALIGIKSTALKLSNHSKKWVTGFYALSLICITLSNGFEFPSALIALPALHAILQIFTWKTYDPESSLYVFKSNILMGIMIWVFLAV